MTRFPGQSIQKDIREEGSCPGQWVHVVDHPGRTKQTPGEGVTRSPCSGRRQNPARSEALPWLLSSLFHPSFLLPHVLCLLASGRRSWQGQRWLCCCGVRGVWWCRWLLRRLEAEVWEFSSGELCARNTLWSKERWRAAIGCPQQRMPSPVPLGRLLRPGRLWETHGQH